MDSHAVKMSRIQSSLCRSRKSELRATHRGGEQATTIDARANLKLRDAAAKTWWNTKAVAAEWVGTNEAQLPFPSVKLHETQEAISGRVALASFALADVLFPLDSNQDMAWALWFQDDKSCLEKLVVEP
ncbi:putative kinase mug58 [Fusarium oxysporum f. sp. albedinis]|nr:putative kinase mug58 [Fusarium oxysporum f. sp. albedinis]